MLQLTPQLIAYLAASKAAAEEREHRKTIAQARRITRKMNRQKFRQLVDTVAATMKMAEPTPFAFEGRWRQGIRSSLVIAGWRWHDADASALEVTGAALRQIGATRPTWPQGQPEWTQPGVVMSERTRCLQCGGRLDPENKVFCSSRCRDSHNHRLHYQDNIDFARAKQRARRAEWRSRQPEQKCEECGDTFRPNSPGQRLCSNRCGVSRMQAVARLTNVQR